MKRESWEEEKGGPVHARSLHSPQIENIYRNDRRMNHSSYDNMFCLSYLTNFTSSIFQFRMHYGREKIEIFS